MANLTNYEINNQVLLEKETIQFIIEKLEMVKEIELLNFTDFDEDQASEDRMASAKNYVECGDLINYLEKSIK